MNVLLRVCDIGVIGDFDTELLVYQMGGSIDAQVLPELHNYILAHRRLEDGGGEHEAWCCSQQAPPGEKRHG